MQTGSARRCMGDGDIAADAARPATVGRQREIEALHTLVDGAAERGAVLLLRGDAGVGKSHLLAAAGGHARARGFAVLSTVGVQSETHLPFAGLHQLLRPILHRVDELPAPQRDAILAAFGMSVTGNQNSFFVALATLNLLADCAARTPLLLTVDDLQWVDLPTCEVLAFVARRIDAEPLALVASVRTGYHGTIPDLALPELTVAGLDDESAARLLRQRAPDLAPAIRHRLLKDAAGNPLALIELPEAIRTEGLCGASVLPAMLPLTARLERAFAARMADLPAETTALLLAAALDDGRGELAEVLEAGSSCDTRLTAEALAPAVAARLLEIDGGRFRFRHSLVRSAVYRAAPEPERRRAHAAWARILAGQPDRQIWHRASAAIQPDEQIAAELEETATRARRRGAVAIAVAAYERAARLTSAPARRSGRLLDTAEMAIELGQHLLVGRLLTEAEQLDPGPRERARIAWLRGMLDDGEPGDAVGVPETAELARRTARAGDLDLALQLLVGAARRCWWGDPGPAARRIVVEAAEQMPVAPTDPRMLAIVALCYPLERGAMVLDSLDQVAPSVGTDAGMASLMCIASYVVGDFERADRLAAATAEQLRAQGRLGPLVQMLTLRAAAGTHLGGWRAAAGAAESTRLALETGQPVWAAAGRTTEARVAALGGDREGAEARIAAIEASGAAARTSSVAAGLQTTRGLIALGEGRYAEAYELLRRIFDPGDPAHHRVQQCWALGYFAEAATHSGHHEHARTVTERLDEIDRTAASPVLQIGLRYARAVLAGDTAEAEELFRSALDAVPPAWGFERGRLELAYGAWLRRRRRVAESRAPLRAARETFDRLGVRQWGERARQELRAAGETSGQPGPGAWDRLSPQEFQIAAMAAEGLSNREISQRLYISHRTVGSHLYRIFPKLGVTSRSQLKAALEQVEQPTA